MALEAMGKADPEACKYYSKECTKLMWAMMAYMDGTGPAPRVVTTAPEGTPQPSTSQQHMPSHAPQQFDAGNTNVASGAGSSYFHGRAQAPPTPHRWRGVPRPTQGRPEASLVDTDEYDYSLPSVVFRNIQ